jgi:hypothetical protein
MSKKSRGWLQVGDLSKTQIIPQVLSSITYEISFDPEAGVVTMDDLLAGAGTVKLRNDFDIPHMSMTGIFFPHFKTQAG